MLFLLRFLIKLLFDFWKNFLNILSLFIFLLLIWIYFCFFGLISEYSNNIFFIWFGSINILLFLFKELFFSLFFENIFLFCKLLLLIILFPFKINFDITFEFESLIVLHISDWFNLNDFFRVLSVNSPSYVWHNLGNEDNFRSLYLYSILSWLGKIRFFMFIILFLFFIE